MNADQARARLAEINSMAKRGDFSFSYDEVVRLRELVPEEVELEKKLEKRRVNNARRRLPRFLAEQN